MDRAIILSVSDKGPLPSKIRKLRGMMSQAQFGAIFGKSEGTVYQWEHGLRAPRSQALKMIADHFGLPQAWFYQEDRGTETGSGPSTMEGERIGDSSLETKLSLRLEWIRGLRQMSPEALVSSVNAFLREQQIVQSGGEPKYLTPEGILAFEAGQAEPSVSQLSALARSLDVSVAELLGLPGCEDTFEPVSQADPGSDLAAPQGGEVGMLKAALEHATALVDRLARMAEESQRQAAQSQRQTDALIEQAAKAQEQAAKGQDERMHLFEERKALLNERAEFRNMLAHVLKIPSDELERLRAELAAETARADEAVKRANVLEGELAAPPGPGSGGAGAEVSA